LNSVSRRLRERLVEKLAQHEDFAAHALSLCARARGRPLVHLCEELGCDEEALLRLAMCRRPRDTGNDFRRDVEQIAHYAGIDPHRLASLFREAQFLAPLARDTAAPDPARILWAAREEDHRFGTPDDARDG